jgi:hypothetical protein
VHFCNFQQRLVAVGVSDEVKLVEIDLILTAIRQIFRRSTLNDSAGAKAFAMQLRHGEIHVP